MTEIPVFVEDCETVSDLDYVADYTIPKYLDETLSKKQEQLHDLEFQIQQCRSILNDPAMSTFGTKPVFPSQYNGYISHITSLVTRTWHSHHLVNQSVFKMFRVKCCTLNECSKLLEFKSVYIFLILRSETRMQMKIEISTLYNRMYHYVSLM